MAKDMFWTVVTFAIIIGIMILAFWPADKGHVVVYDCRLAEISADIPVAVKEECRKRSTK
jgi:F0F1-type ATP synthase membrane subunit b/b'